MLKQLCEKLSSMLLSDDGINWSTMRFSVIFITILSSICYWGVWVSMCFIKHGVMDMPTVITGLYIGIITVSMGAKITQSVLAENKKDTA